MIDEIAYIGLGSNLDDPADQVKRAMRELDGIPGTRCIARSSLYGGPPMGPQDQPDYINAVAALQTRLGPGQLLAELQAIEKRHGRVRGNRWGARTLDLDILLFGSLVLDAPGLRIPHPGIAERAFVLLPLKEIAPELLVPGLGRVGDLLDACGEQAVTRVGDP